MSIIFTIVCGSELRTGIQSARSNKKKLNVFEFVKNAIQLQHFITILFIYLLLYISQI